MSERILPSRRSFIINTALAGAGLLMAGVIGCDNTPDKPHGEYSILTGETHSLNANNLSTSPTYIDEMRIYYDGTIAYVTMNPDPKAYINDQTLGGFVPYDPKYDVSRALSILNDNPTLYRKVQPDPETTTQILKGIWKDKQPAGARLAIHKVTPGIQLMFVVGEGTTHIRGLANPSLQGVDQAIKPAIIRAQLTFV